MNDNKLTRAPLGWALLVFIILLAIYMLFPTQFHGGDALQAAIVVQRDVKGEHFYHPVGSLPYTPDYLSTATPPGSTQEMNTRYFLDYPMLTLANRVFQFFGYSGNVIMPIITYRSIVGALAAVFTFLGAWELTRTRWLALLVSLGLGLTASYWTFSTDIYQSITMAMLVAAAFYILVRLAKSEKRVNVAGLIILGAVLAFSVLHNIMTALALPAFGLAVLLIQPGSTLSQRLQRAVAFGAGLVVVTVVGFALVTLIVLPSESGPSNPLQWSDESGGSVNISEFDPAEDAFRAVIGFGKSQVMYPGVVVRDYQAVRKFWDAAGTPQKATFVGFYVLVWIVYAIPVVILFLRRRVFPVQYRWLWLLLPLLFLAYAAFNWWWLPSDVHYWLVPLFVWWTALGLAVYVLKDTRWFRPMAALAAALIAISFVLNLMTQFWPESHTENPWFTAAETLRQESQPNALFITDGHTIDFYIAYFTRRDIVATNIVNEQSQNNSAVLNRTLVDKIEAHRADDGEVYIYTANASNLDALVQSIGLSGQDQLEAAWTFADLTIYRALFELTA